ncbi:hypothetical protein [Streptomyces tagetis]|uniref:Uncharacterized protein n=1 Tax=Streptomyces tagetis TaxID=2820809 RepID=A0A941B064_9ACTN|nr:hypothetical protein [Streptomyces sp. RG38]MBQ0826331.1 hypothetical protein [Streptomyces sp. RG38]
MTGNTPEPQENRNDRDDRRDGSPMERRERERAESRPFTYRYPERRANVRATRRVSRARADADRVPGVPGGYGSTGGGQPGGGSTPRAGEDTADESGVTDIVGGRPDRPSPRRGGGR